MNTGSLHIEADNIAQARLLTKLEKLGDFEVSVQSNARLNTSKGVITCRDFMVCSEEELKNEMAELGIIDVKRINKRQQGTLIATASLILTFDRPKPPEEIDICFFKLRVRPYIPSPMRCYNCLKFGHTSVRCRSAAQVCACGLMVHEGNPCQDPPICVNCTDFHSSRAPECLVFQEEKEIQRVKTLQSLSYYEAKKIVKSKAYVKPQMSFAAVARSKAKPVVQVTDWQKIVRSHLYTANQGPSQPVYEARDKKENQSAGVSTRSAADPAPSPMEVGSNTPSSSTSQANTLACPPPPPPSTIPVRPNNLAPTVEGKSPPVQVVAGVTPAIMRFPQRTPNKRELRSREKRAPATRVPQPVPATVNEGSSREEGGSDTDSGGSNKTVLNESQVFAERLEYRKKKPGRPKKRSNASGMTTA